jgi:uncharacterized protein (DUF2267 family)
MKERELSQAVKERAGLKNIAEATRALRAALGAFGCALEEDDARATSSQLAPELAHLFARSAEAAPVRSADELYAEADRREGVGRGFATEHVQVVLEVVAERFDPELVARLCKRLPSDIAALLRERRDVGEAPPHIHAHPAHEPEPIQTLARARPGSADPIAEAHHPLAHAASTARTDTPHSHTMVETARSTRPGREDDTLASTRGDEPRRRS